MKSGYPRRRRQDEIKEETMEDRTGIDRARRLDRKTDTENNQEV
jgi:hypothetical protein